MRNFQLISGKLACTESVRGGLEFDYTPVHIGLRKGGIVVAYSPITSVFPCHLHSSNSPYSFHSSVTDAFFY